MQLRKTRIWIALLAAGVASCGPLPATVGAHDTSARPQPQIDRVALEQLVDSVLTIRMDTEHVPGAVFVLVQQGRVVLAKGYGLADLDAGRSVSPDSTIWRIGSITKVFTAAAVMQLADRQRLKLDADVNSYLKRLQVPQTYREPITPAHLLTHTGGFDEIPGVRLAPSRDALRPLDEFLRDRLVRVRPPGRVTSYSSYGLALAGLLVEDVSGLPYEEYLRRNIFQPLGMSRTHVTPTPDLHSNLATGYEYRGGTNRPAPYEWYHTVPASAINASAADMGRFMIALLGTPGSAPPILSPDAVRAMQRRHATMHPLIPGWGYGLQENDINGQRIFEHGGDIAGFSSLMVLLPDHHSGFFIANHHEGSNLRFTLQQALLTRFFPDRRDLIPPPPPTGTRTYAEKFAGVYRWNIYCRMCTAPQQLPEVAVRANDDGSITVVGKQWIEVSPLFFRSVDGKERLGFATDSTGRIMHLTGGSWNVVERVR